MLWSHNGPRFGERDPLDAVSVGLWGELTPNSGLCQVRRLDSFRLLRASDSRLLCSASKTRIRACSVLHVVAISAMRARYSSASLLQFSSVSSSLRRSTSRVECGHSKGLVSAVLQRLCEGRDDMLTDDSRGGWWVGLISKDVSMLNNSRGPDGDKTRSVGYSHHCMDDLGL